MQLPLEVKHNVLFVSSDLLRPFSRIHHHSLPKAVIHIRRHCFGRRRLKDTEFLIQDIMSMNIQAHGYVQQESPRCLVLFLSPVFRCQRISWECPEPGHDWSQTPEPSPRGVRLWVARAETGCQHRSHREETSSKKKRRRNSLL